jgi:hypothetical protein
VAALPILVAYALGAGVGLAVPRAGRRLQRDWPLYLRGQLFVTAAGVGLLAAWRLTAPRQLVGPVLIAAVAFVLLAAATVTRRGRSLGEASLETWAAEPNGLFWVLPVAGAFGGAAAITVAALANAIYAVPNAVCTHLMRRDAPVPQRHATSWIDQSAFIALGLGLLGHLVGPAPTWSGLVLGVAAPVLAFTGAALFIGSVVHPHNTEVARGASATRRWLWLSGVRAAYLVAVALVVATRADAVVAVLSAFTVPAFMPIQLAVLYGYRSGAVNAAARWGWFALPFGLLAAWLV